MVVRYGRTCEDGFLPVFSTDTEEQAERLLIATCKRNYDGEYVAPELMEVQTLEKLYAFRDRLAALWQDHTFFDREIT